MEIKELMYHIGYHIASLELVGKTLDSSNIMETKEMLSILINKLNQAVGRM